MKHVEVHTGAWHGDRRLQLSFPDSWNVEVVGQSAGPALDRAAMQRALQSPIGTPRLAELAGKCRTAAIIIDDISRPTPTADILPLVLDELEAGGMSLSQVRVVIAAGGHEPASTEENLLKVGAESAARVAWELHDPDGDLVHAGESPSGIPLHINRTVMEAELKIGIGGITPHDSAGFSGGSKILVPGVAGTQSARYLHDLLKGAKHRGGSIDNDFRRELDVITGRLGLNFIVNVILNHQRQIAHLFAGDRVLAHREGVQVAAEKFAVTPPRDAEIVVVNTYPFDPNLWFVPWGTWPLMDTPDGVTRIAIADGSQGVGGHRLKPTELSLLERAHVRLKTLRPRHVLKQVRHLVTSLTRTQSRRRLQFDILCPHISPEDLARRFPAATLYRTWDEVLAALQRKHGNGSVKVAVYPCAPLQFARAPEGKR
ncbi:MAG: lactate racemase domain-containing protein [Gemmatimonadota bacterium]|nr:lactate racemase domain-containing protein [Gemmatimonadota bacterium]